MSDNVYRNSQKLNTNSSAKSHGPLSELRATRLRIPATCKHGWSKHGSSIIPS